MEFRCVNCKDVVEQRLGEPALATVSPALMPVWVLSLKGDGAWSAGRRQGTPSPRPSPSRERGLACPALPVPWEGGMDRGLAYPERSLSPRGEGWGEGTGRNGVRHHFSLLGCPAAASATAGAPLLQKPGLFLIGGLARRTRKGWTCSPVAVEQHAFHIDAGLAQVAPAG